MTDDTRMGGRITLGLQIDQLVSGYARLIFAGVEDWSKTLDANLIVFSGRVIRMDIIARFGGDELTVLAVDTGPDFYEILRARLEAGLAAYNAGSRKPYRLSMSIGAVPFDQSSILGLGELLERADETLCAEKKRKKDTAK